MSISSGHGFRTQKRVVDCLLSSLYDCLKERRHYLVSQCLDLSFVFARPNPVLRNGAEGDHIIAAPIGRGRPGASKSEHGARRESPEIARIERRIGCDHHNDRAVSLITHLTDSLSLDLLLEIILTEFTADGSAIDCQYSPEIGLHQRSDCISAEGRRNHSR